MRDETEIGGVESRFQDTSWTMIRHAQAGSGESLERLLSGYWKPIYYFIRRKGHDVEKAKDLTQSFCATFVEKGVLRSVAPERGKFRSFVMAAVQHYLSDERDRERAVKRGGRFNFVQAEIDLGSADPGPETAFFKEWAATVMARAMERLRIRADVEDLALLEGAPLPEITGDDRKNRLRRIRGQLRECLREVIRPLVERESEIDEELQELFAHLGDRP